MRKKCAYCQKYLPKEKISCYDGKEFHWECTDKYREINI
jgi:hypothetical protein